MRNVLKYSEFIGALEIVPDKDKPAFIKEELRSKKRLHIFGKLLFPHIIKGNYETPDCHIDLIAELTAFRDSAIIFPRSFAKTSWEKIDTIHDIVYGLEPVILYISSTITDAQFHFDSMKSELENNQFLIALYGNLVPGGINPNGKWTNKHFETLNNVNVVARGACKGRGVNIKNQRPSKIVIDDAEDDSMVRSPDQRLKYHYWLYNVILPSLDKDSGKVKVIGTVLHQQCELLKFYKEHGGIFKRGEENGKSIWEEYWSMDKLMKLKTKIGTRSYNQEILNNPITGEMQMIKPEWVENSMYTNLDERDMKKVLMLDPQSGESKTADFYGLVKAGKYKGDKHRYVLSVQTGRCSQLDQAALFIRAWLQDRKNIYIAGIEKVLSQVAVYQFVIDWKNFNLEFQGKNADLNIDNRNIPIVAVSPEGKDKVARMQMHEAAFERGEIHLHATMQKFAERLTMFPELDHDDDLDSLIFCLEYLNKRNLLKVSEGTKIKVKTISGNMRQAQF